MSGIAPGTHKPSAELQFAIRCVGCLRAAIAQRSHKRSFKVFRKTTDFTLLQSLRNQFHQKAARHARGRRAGEQRPPNLPQCIQILIPYVGINRNLSSSREKGDSVTANTRDIGLSFDGSHLLVRGDNERYINNVFIVRPDYLDDIQHHSHIVSLNSIYMPVVTKLLNAYFPIVPGEEHFASIMLVFDMRLDAGHYTACGSLTGDTCTNYVRAGVSVWIRNCQR